jgi:hypothetical protein
MNIFFTNPTPLLCATALDDLRLNKMVLETAQLLSGAIHSFIDQGDNRLTADEQAQLYRSTHINHPSAKFARSTARNFTWLVMHFDNLAQEFEGRRSKTHKSYYQIRPLTTNYTDWDHDSYILEADDIKPYLACDADLKLLEDPFLAYRKHMLRKWLVDDTPTWTNRPIPEWACEYLPHGVSKY